MSEYFRLRTKASILKIRKRRVKEDIEKAYDIPIKINLKRARTYQLYTWHNEIVLL